MWVKRVHFKYDAILDRDYTRCIKYVCEADDDKGFRQHISENIKIYKK